MSCPPGLAWICGEKHRITERVRAITRTSGNGSMDDWARCGTLSSKCLVVRASHRVSTTATGRTRLHTRGR
ncbi:hypothetical protein CP978_22580 [Streptomyces nodosus]|uniref:Uncharacterized protein n=1 Tax=Streptomyces nodosus TaxID=40318 RepID=A0A5P2W5R8_9ACTN|nr:hypothetical protein CP978_22580 [Streptomyces nodosus]